jgi:hypothetical protein
MQWKVIKCKWQESIFYARLLFHCCQHNHSDTKEKSYTYSPRILLARTYSESWSALFTIVVPVAEKKWIQTRILITRMGGWLRAVESVWQKKWVDSWVAVNWHREICVADLCKPTTWLSWFVFVQNRQSPFIYRDLLKLFLGFHFKEKAVESWTTNFTTDV